MYVLTWNRSAKRYWVWYLDRRRATRVGSYPSMFAARDAYPDAKFPECLGLV